MKKIKEDFYTYTSGSKAKAVSTLLFGSGFKATLNYRIANYFYKKFNSVVIPKWLQYINRVKYSIDIDYRAEIDGGFHIVHGIGIVIGYDVRIGKNVSIYQGVTLGGNSGKQKEKDGIVFTQPWICNNCNLYANCMALGPVYIGENSVIAAGAVIFNDVPKDAVVYCKQEVKVKTKTQNIEG